MTVPVWWARPLFSNLNPSCRSISPPAGRRWLFSVSFWSGRHRSSSWRGRWAGRRSAGAWHEISISRGIKTRPVATAAIRVPHLICLSTITQGGSVWRWTCSPIFPSPQKFDKGLSLASLQGLTVFENKRMQDEHNSLKYPLFIHSPAPWDSFLLYLSTLWLEKVLLVHDSFCLTKKSLFFTLFLPLSSLMPWIQIFFQSSSQIWRKKWAD